MEFVRLRDIKLEDYIGNRVKVSFLALNVTDKPQKNSERFISLDMTDSGVKYDAKIFSVTQSMINDITAGKVFDAIIDIKPYKGSYSCIIADIRESELLAKEFIGWVDNVEGYYENIKNAIDVLEGTVYGDIVGDIISLQWDKFSVWPAAKSIHHTELGGLVAHTAVVAKCAIGLGQLYNQIYGDNFINLPLLIAATLIHDVGKVCELDIDTNSGEANYAVAAALNTHIMNALELIDRIAISKGLMDTEEVRLLKHTVASHHGKKEWGSPIEPSIPEAALLHRMDELDAVMYRFNKELKSIKPGQSNSIWNNNNIITYYKENDS